MCSSKFSYQIQIEKPFTLYRLGVKSRRKRPRTPTPGQYLGLGKPSYRRRHRAGGGYGRDDYERRRSPPRRSPPYRGGRGYSPRRSPYAERSRRYRSRSYSPYGRYAR